MNLVVLTILCDSNIWCVFAFRFLNSSASKIATYEDMFFNHLQRIMGDVDKRIRRGQARLAMSQKKDDVSVFLFNMEPLSCITRKCMKRKLKPKFIFDKEKGNINASILMNMHLLPLYGFEKVAEKVLIFASRNELDASRYSMMSYPFLDGRRFFHCFHLLWPLNKCGHPNLSLKDDSNI